MGQYDKDRHQKEMAIRFCLSRGIVPFIEVIVSSFSDLSSTTEVLTDLDVLGLEYVGDGDFNRKLFDCKTTRMSAINRAFWAAGILEYTNCTDAIVILKNRAVHNHRISALKVKVDLHDEKSFEDFGKTFDIGFNTDMYYQSSIDRWNAVFESYSKNEWSEGLFGLLKSMAPLTSEPWSVFRKTIAELRNDRGQFDPGKSAHLVIFFDMLATLSILWSAMGRDIRRFYSPGMPKDAFAEVLRFYIWGGKESYYIRQEMRGKIENGTQGTLELPAWDRFVNLAGLVIAAPHEFFACAHICREIAFRCATTPLTQHDSILKKSISTSRRVSQYIPSLAEYLVYSCGLPKDFLELASAALQLK